jgi:hypothetical protein
MNREDSFGFEPGDLADDAVQGNVVVVLASLTRLRVMG